MAGRRPDSIALAAAGCAGASAWVSLGALAVIDAAPGAPRVGLLPPPWALFLLVAAAIGLAWIVRLPRERAWPLFFPLLTVLPWMPGPVPMPVLIWTGPVAILVWTVTATCVAIASACGPREEPEGSAAQRRLRARGAWGWGPTRSEISSRAPLAAGAIAFVCYAGAAARLSFEVSGDEPHYLVITQSILHDFDLRIENNHRAGQFTSYVRGELKPDYLRRGRDGQIYSIHAPGVPALIAPAFAFFGHHGAILFLALVSAAASVLVWKACAAVVERESAAWFGWAAVSLTVPFFFQSFAVYPEAAGAAGVMCGVYALVDTAAPRHRWFWYGAALALLPWLHTRLAIAAAILGVAIVIRLLSRTDRWSAIALFAAAPAMSAAGWFGFFAAIYGTANPAAPYGGYTQSAITNIPRGLTGLLFDQQFGIVPNAPVLAIALGGFAVFARRRTRLAGEIACLIVAYAAVTAAYHMWWGGHSSPGRFLVAVLLPLALPAAVAFDTARSTAARSLMLIALATSFALTGILLFAADGRFVFNARDGFALWLEWISPLVDLPRGVPSVLRDGPAIALAQTAWWIAVLAAFVFAAGRLMRLRQWDAGRRLLALSIALALGVTAAVAGVWRMNGVRDLTASSAQVAMLRRAARMPGAVALKYSPFQIVARDSALARLDIASSARRPREPEAADLELPAIPAGVYRLHVRAPAAFSGALQARAGASDAPIDTWPVAVDRGRDADLPLTLPVAVASLGIRHDRSGGEPIDMTLRPVSIARAQEPRPAIMSARYGASRLFVLDPLAYLESTGAWLSAGTTRMAIDPAPRALFVRNTSRDNVVRIETSGIAERLELRAREERTVALPPTAEAFRLLRISVDEGVVPAIVDPASADYRNLGLWIEVR